MAEMLGSVPRSFSSKDQSHLVCCVCSSSAKVSKGDGNSNLLLVLKKLEEIKNLKLYNEEAKMAVAEARKATDFDWRELRANRLRTEIEAIKIKSGK